jgi:hypothetical protein
MPGMTMNYPPKRSTLTYIVRIWAEYLDGPQARWCGEIEQAGDGQKAHFASLEEMTEFIRQRGSQSKPDRSD